MRQRADTEALLLYPIWGKLSGGKRHVGDHRLFGIALDRSHASVSTAGETAL